MAIVVHEAADHSKVLAKASKDLSSSLDLEATLNRVATLALENLADWCVVHLVNADLSVSQVLVAHRDPAKIELVRDLERRFPYGLDAPHGIPHVLRTGRPERIRGIAEPELRAVARNDEHFALLKSIGMSSAMLVPLTAHGKTIGAISFAAAESGRMYEPADLGFALALAEHAALALENARLYRNAQMEIADRRRTEEALHRSQERVRALFQASDQALLLIDDHGHCVDANPGACALTGYDREELLERGLWDLMPGGGREELQQEWRASLEVGVQHREIAVLRKEGARVDTELRVVAHFGPRLHLCLFQDITDRKRAETALRESEELLRQLVEGVREYALFVVDPAGRVASWNFGAEHLKGYSAAEIIGKSLSVFFTPEDQDAGKPGKLLQQAASEGQAKDEGWRVTKEGRRFWADVMITALYDPAGGLRGFVKLTRDMSARREIELEIRNVHDRLERRVQERTAQLQDALREMETFTYTMAHDLRGPLRTMAGFSQLLVEEYADQFAQGLGRLYLEQLDAGARKMDALISDLLSYGQLSRKDLEHGPVDLESAAWEAVASLAAPVSEKHAEIMVASPLPSVQGHRSTLVLVLSNLISNALKFVPPGKRPSVRVIAEEFEESVRVWVEDNGIGIERKYLERIFGIFERLHRSEEYPGTGIGLALVRRAVTRMGGRCGVDSTPGIGSRFWVELPRAVPSDGPPAAHST